MLHANQTDKDDLLKYSPDILHKYIKGWQKIRDIQSHNQNRFVFICMWQKRISIKNEPKAKRKMKTETIKNKATAIILRALAYVYFILYTLYLVRVFGKHCLLTASISFDLSLFAMLN